MKLDEIVLRDFSGGINEGVPELIEGHQLRECLNYDLFIRGKLTKRKSCGEYNEDLPTGVSNVVKPWIWKPRFMPTGAERDYLLLLPESGGDLWCLYFDGTEWKGVNDAGTTPIFTGLGAKVRVAEVGYGVVICDGRDNSILKRIEINSDGDVDYGDLGLPAPLGMASASGASADNEYVENDSLDPGMTIVRGSVISICYTMVTKDGLESNPSPVFVYDDLNYLYKDTEHNLEQYWQRATLNHLRTLMADESGHDGLLDQVESFKIYMGAVPYTGGNVPRGDLKLVDTIPVSQITGDNFYVATEPLVGAKVSYENDLGCKGDDICSTGDVLFVANGNSRIEFPFIFENYFKIILLNKNTRFYSNGVICVKLSDADLVDKDGNPIIVWADITTSDYINSSELPKLRIFDNELTTPLAVNYKYFYGDAFIYIWMKAPYIGAGFAHSLYLVYGGDGVPAQSAAQTNFRTYKYGKWFNAGIGLTIDQEVFIPNRVRDSHTLVSCSNEYHTDKSCPNRANGNAPFELSGFAGWEENHFEIVELLSGFREILYYNSTDDKNFLRTADAGSATGGAKSTMTAITCTKLQFMSFVQVYFNSAGSTMIKFPICRFNESDSKWIKLEVQMDPTTNVAKWYAVSDVFASDILIKTHPIVASVNQKWYVHFNVNIETKKITLYLYIFTSGTTEYIVEDMTLDMQDEFLLKEVLLGCAADQTPIRFYSGYSQVQVRREEYLDSTNEYEYRQFMNFSPYFPEEWIGWNGSENKNIEIYPGKKIEYNTPMGMLKYSSLGGKTLPDLNYVWASGPTMRIIPAPNYLSDGRYLNTVLIFGKQGERQRFILSGDPSSWRSSVADLLVRELSFYGLLNEFLLIKVGETIHYLSPAGLIQEDSSGRKIINIGKDGMKKLKFLSDHLINGNIIYNPRDNQLLLLGELTGISYEYDGISVDP